MHCVLHACMQRDVSVASYVARGEKKKCAQTAAGFAGQVS
jgi:hypothetical protein